MVTHRRLLEVLHYDPNTGKFTWRISSITKKAGEEAGGFRSDGYMRIAIDGDRYYAHRLAWFYMNGAWPAGEIDHINGDPSDNSLANLREAARTENSWNAAKRKSNSSGFKGVSFCPRDHRWIAKIRTGQTRKFLGRFDTPEDAAEAYRVAAEKYHGEFARYV